VLESGSVIVARHEDELEVMAGAARDERRGARVITREEVAELAPIPIDGVVGALHARRDIRVDPRRAVAGLASLLEQDPGARVIWNAHAHGADPGRVDACRLQMLRVAGPGGRRYAPALLTGLSLLRYPAFTAQPGCERVRARITEERPELVAAGTT